MERDESRREPTASLQRACPGEGERRLALTAEVDPASRLLAAFELLGGLGILAAFVVLLLAPAAVRFVGELPWIFGALPTPQFGINPHHSASGRHLPPLLVVAACAALPLCYRWLASRRRD